MTQIKNSISATPSVMVSSHSIKTGLSYSLPTQVSCTTYASSCTSGSFNAKSFDIDKYVIFVINKNTNDIICFFDETFGIVNDFESAGIFYGEGTTENFVNNYCTQKIDSIYKSSEFIKNILNLNKNNISLSSQRKYRKYYNTFFTNLKRDEISIIYQEREICLRKIKLSQIKNKIKNERQEKRVFV